MCQYPEVQRKAQAELDAVVGPHRLPHFGVRDPYINAVIKEALRWHIVLPLGLPHRTVQDDEIDGYFLPADTILIPNTWAMMQDADAYDKPGEFYPDRFIRDGELDTTVRDPAAYVFGYGRRVCAGRHFADEMLYLAIASVLHVFIIEPPLDENGQPVKVEHRQSPGLISYVHITRVDSLRLNISGGVNRHPEDFQCVLKLRYDNKNECIFISKRSGLLLKFP